MLYFSVLVILWTEHMIRNILKQFATIAMFLITTSSYYWCSVAALIPDCLCAAFRVSRKLRYGWRMVVRWRGGFCKGFLINATIVHGQHSNLKLKSHTCSDLRSVFSCRYCPSLIHVVGGISGSSLPRGYTGMLMLSACPRSCLFLNWRTATGMRRCDWISEHPLRRENENIFLAGDR